VRIRLRQNGPYVIDDADVQVVDWNGMEYPIDRRPVALCRCGASGTKPFCDGTHSKVGWRGAAAAAPGEDAAVAAPSPEDEGRGH
jgi:CDGSH-type Zn-finger protein